MHVTKELIDELKEDNPYPKDIFPPLSDDKIKSYVKLLTDNGFSSDAIHAHWMRRSWDLCINKLENLIKEHDK